MDGKLTLFSWWDWVEPCSTMWCDWMMLVFQKYHFSLAECAVKWWRCFRFQLFIKHIYIVLALWDLDAMCKRSGKTYLYIPQILARPIDWQTGEQSLKQNMIIWHPPFWESNTLQFNSKQWTGDVYSGTLQ